MAACKNAGRIHYNFTYREAEAIHGVGRGFEGVLGDSSVGNIRTIHDAAK